jgi:hypothetical protein
MTEKNTTVRSLHDLGLAAWFGGSLMGALGVQGAASAVSDLGERVQAADAGWRRWQPVETAAVAAHLVGGLGLLAANKTRVASQPGARANTAGKTLLTGVAVGLSAYNKRLGQRVARDRDREAQQRLHLTQWALPVVTGVLVVMGADQGEQQRPQSLLRAQAARLPRRS